jgi:hypothetical protein
MRIFNMHAFVVKLALLAALSVSAAAPALKPVYTQENGTSCGRTPQMPDGIECDAPQCYDTAVSREFSNWDGFEKGFLLNEMKTSGLLAAPSDFSDLCTNYAKFTPEEKQLFWLDFLKLMAGFENSFRWASSFDDMVGGKIVTERGFFQVAKVDCVNDPAVQADYCAVHWPKVNARCALRIMSNLVKVRKGKTIDAIAAHWGSMRTSLKNSEGGRREKLRASFMQQPACSAVLNTSAKPAKATNLRSPKAATRPTSTPADDPLRPHYARLTAKMYPDSDFVSGAFLPSYHFHGAAPCDNLDPSNAKQLEQCHRFMSWQHYQQVDLQFAAGKVN